MIENHDLHFDIYWELLKKKYYNELIGNTIDCLVKTLEW